YGGGIFNWYGTLTVTNSTIIGNSTTNTGNTGGGLSNYGTTTITNSTISGNAATNGGGIYNSGTVTVANTIISGNSAGTGAEFRNFGTFNADANNLFGHSGLTNADAFTGFTPGASDITATSDGTDPTALAGILNTSLAFNGGPTRTHALVVGSPAINAGDNTHAFGLTSDQRGTPFVRAFGTVDIGAYEMQPRTLVVDTLVDESDGDFSAGDLSLREAIEWANANAGADTITFDADLAGGTITLGGTQITISDDLTITGLGADQLTIDADGLSRIFNIDDGTGTAIDVEIVGLTLTGGDPGGSNDGGAILNQESLAIAESVISGNAAYLGGGIYNYGILAIVDSVISGNEALQGGGISQYGSYAELTVVNTTISGNTADELGGGIVNFSGKMTIANSTIADNLGVSYGGGGIFNFNHDPSHTTTILNSTITGNSTGAAGGGIYHNGGILTSINNTITNNTAGYFGGGVALLDDGFTATTANLSNNIISGNSTVGDGTEVYNDAAVTFNSNSNLFGHSGLANADALDGVAPHASDITATSDGTDPTALAGILNPTLAFNGGSTRTHALVVGSPAINAGNNANLPADTLDLDGDGNVVEALPVDQRGVPFTRTSGTVDIGAFELQPGVVFDGTNGDDEITVSLAGAMFVVTVNGVDHEVDPADIDHIEVRGLAGNDTLHIIGTPGVDNTTLHPGTVELVGTGITLVGDSFEAIDVASGGGQDRANLWDSVGDDEYVATPTSASLQGPGFINRVDGYRRAYAYSYAGGFDTVEFNDSAGNDNFVGEEARSWLTNAGVATYYNSASRFDRVSAYASTGYDVAMMWDSADDDAFQVEPSLGSLSGGGFNNRAHDFNRVYAYSYVGGVDEAHFYDSSGDDRFIGKDIRSTIQNADITYYGSVSRFEEVYAYAVNGGNDRADLHGNANSDTLVSGVDATTMSASNYFYEVTDFETVNATAGGGGTDVADLADSAGDDWFLDIPASSYVVWGNNNRISAFNFSEVDFESLFGGNDLAEFRSLGTLDDVFGLDDLVEVTRTNGRVVQAQGASLAEVIAESLAAPGPITNLTSLDYIYTQTGVWS
ncbi:MAG: right-handed parallel beta-helix repeat-containing protein, partial [Planctomycetaceae bacterium]